RISCLLQPAEGVAFFSSRLDLRAIPGALGSLHMDNPYSVRLATDALRKYSELCAEFDHAWREFQFASTDGGREPPAVEAFLPGEVDFILRAAVLTELIKIDMDFRRAQAGGVDLQDYLGRLPELASLQDALVYLRASADGLPVKESGVQAKEP